MNLMMELDAAEIGGIGEIKRKTLRFDSYRIGTEDGKLTIYAEFTNGTAPKIFTGYPAGQELLLDLINLYQKILKKKCLKTQKYLELLVDYY